LTNNRAVPRLQSRHFPASPTWNRYILFQPRNPIAANVRFLCTPPELFSAAKLCLLWFAYFHTQAGMPIFLFDALLRWFHSMCPLRPRILPSNAPRLQHFEYSTPTSLFESPIHMQHLVPFPPKNAHARSTMFDPQRPLARRRHNGVAVFPVLIDFWSTILRTACLKGGSRFSERWREHAGRA
jgi:hypothetical protein